MTAVKWLAAVMIVLLISLGIRTVEANYDLHECWACDFNKQSQSVGVIDLEDLSVLTNYWLETECSEMNWCMDTDLDKSDAIDLNDFAIFASCWHNADDIAPDPVEWEQKPFGTFLGGDSVTMTIADSFDAWTGDWTKSPEHYYTEYVIERRSADELEFNEIKTIRIDSPNPDPDVWPQVNTLKFTDSDLWMATEYTYRFKVIDAAGNQSQWSTEETAIGGFDIQPPENVQWQIFPYAIAAYSDTVTMKADIAVDQNHLVEYLFVRLDLSGSASGSAYGCSIKSYDNTTATILTPFEEPVPTDAAQLLQYANDNQETMTGWIIYDEQDTYQNAINFQDVGLVFGAAYNYYFLVRDVFGNIAISQAASVVAGVDVIDQTPPDPNPSTWGLLPVSYDDLNGFHHHYMVAALATDAQSPHVEYYFETLGGARTSGWITDNIYDTKVPAANTYKWHHRTRSIVYDALGQIMHYNVSQWSQAETPDDDGGDIIDQTPPNPNPSQWDSLPEGYVDGDGFHRHYMVAATATDPQSPDVEYYFETLDGATASGWITDNSFDTKVPAANAYKWRHRSRSIVYNALGQVIHYNQSQWSQAVTPDDDGGDDIDQTPPNPNPSEWDSQPVSYVDGYGFHHHKMVAAIAIDAQSPEVDYYFETLDGTATSGWFYDNKYDTKVPAANNYRWRHRTRSVVRDAHGQVIHYNVSQWSQAVTPIVEDEVPIDTTPPNPNPPTWETPPMSYYNGYLYHHYMVATRATDPQSPHIEYYFETLNGLKSSGWTYVNNYNIMAPDQVNTYSWRYKTRSIVYNALGQVIRYNVSQWSKAVLVDL